MALDKTPLYHHELAIAEDSEHVGYDSASTFSTALSRHVGQAPGRYARKRIEKSAAVTSLTRAPTEIRSTPVSA